MWAMPTSSRTTSADPGRLKPRHSSHQGNITKPPLFLYMNIHSPMHAFIHSIHPKASHMQLNASQRSVLHHEVAVALFNKSNDRGRLTSNRAWGENADEPRVALA